MKLDLSSQKIFRIVILAIISWLIFFPLDFILSYGFISFLDKFFRDGRNEVKYELINNETAAYVFGGLKVLAILVFIWLAITWLDFFKNHRLKTTKFLLKISDTVYFSFLENKKYVLDLGKKVMYSLLIVLSTQFFFCTYFLFTIPVGYDEWWSYNYFSFNGIWATLCYYPIPNNHVFFNVISGLFLYLPIDMEVSLRLPSLIASIISTYYFFKICKCSFNATFSLFLLMFVISSFPFIFYSFMARGYAFAFLFCVLMIYSSIQLFSNYKSRKYRYLFIFSVYFGLFSLPSFLYTFLPVLLVFPVYLLIQKRFFDIVLLIKDSFISLILSIGSYSFILFFNNPENLLNPNRQPANYFIKAPGSVNNIIDHLKLTADFFLFNEKVILIATVLAIVSTFIFVYRVKGVMQYICVLSLAMVFSPLYLLVIHGQIPFERTWSYLIFPITLCIGFIIKNLVYYMAKITSLERFAKVNIYLQSAALIVCVDFLLSFTNLYKKKTGRMEYQFEELKEQHLKYLMVNVKKIAYTEVAYEYYLTGMVSAVCYKYAPENKVEMTGLVNVDDQDILIIDRSVLSKYYRSLKKYKVLKYIDNGQITVYAKASLLGSN